MKVPESLQEELDLWGSDFDLECWVSVQGNFSLAVGYASIFNPNFVEYGDYIFRVDAEYATTDKFRKDVAVRAHDHDAFSVEWLINHLHIADIQQPESEDISADKLIFIGHALKDIYEAKLAHQFPDKPCEVKFYLPECTEEGTEDLRDYQIAFWQTKHRLAKE